MSDTEVSADGRELRCAVVGLGAMGSHHLRILTSQPGVAVVAVAEPDAQRRSARLRMHPGVRAYERLEQVLDAEQMDLVCLAVPIDVMPGCVMRALEAGIHVFAEKPMAPDEGQGRELVDAAAERGLILGVGYVERFNPAVVALKQKLHEGTIGKIVQMHARRLSPFPNRARMTGVTLDLATHEIDLMRSLTGAEVEHVYAEAFSGSNNRRDDLLSAVLRFDSGSTGLLEVNWITPTKVRQLSVLGEGGLFVVDYLMQDLTLYEHPTKPTEWDQLAGMRGGGEGDMVRFALERREPLRLQWEAFLAAVRDGSAAPVGGEDALATLSTACAIRVAAAERRIVAPADREIAGV
jgi:UDP-N-acetylglucosamine 3-dehydrogenase